MNIGRVISFATAVIGSFYVLMTLSLLIHEVGGHLLAGALCGARTFSFSVTPGFGGWAISDYIRSESADRFVVYAGIGINAIVGLCALAFLRLRRPGLSNLGLVAFWVAVTQSGHAIGYLLQGVLFGYGDGGALARAPRASVRYLIIACLIALFLLLAAWALCTIAAFVRGHFRSTTKMQLLRDHLVAFAFPVAILILVVPGMRDQPFGAQLAFNGAVMVVLLLGSALAVQVVAKTEPQPQAMPISGAVGAVWTAAAITVALFTELWLASGVEFSFA